MYVQQSTAWNTLTISGYTWFVYTFGPTHTHAHSAIYTQTHIHTNTHTYKYAINVGGWNVGGGWNVVEGRGVAVKCHIHHVMHVLALRLVRC